MELHVFLIMCFMPVRHQEFVWQKLRQGLVTFTIFPLIHVTGLFFHCVKLLGNLKGWKSTQISFSFSSSSSFVMPSFVVFIRCTLKLFKWLPLSLIWIYTWICSFLLLQIHSREQPMCVRLKGLFAVRVLGMWGWGGVIRWEVTLRSPSPTPPRQQTHFSATPFSWANAHTHTH